MQRAVSRLCLVVPGLLILTASQAVAQSVGFHIVRLSARHELLGTPLMGPAADITLPRQAGRIVFRFGAEKLVAHSSRVGFTCAGLVPPGTCAPQPVRDDARILSANGGVVLRVLSLRHADLELTADVSAASVRAVTFGLKDGGRLAATKLLGSGQLGAGMKWTPVDHVPLALQLEGAIGGFTPLVNHQLLDGYNPFDRAFGLTRYRAGIVWHRTR